MSPVIDEEKRQYVTVTGKGVNMIGLADQDYTHQGNKQHANHFQCGQCICSRGSDGVDNCAVHTQGITIDPTSTGLWKTTKKESTDSGDG
eukprot:1880180-Amphidinium_carterae.1